MSDPLDGKTHDAKAFTHTPAADIVTHSGGGIGDKGYQGCDDMATTRWTPPKGELSRTRTATPRSPRSARPSSVSLRTSSHGASWRVFHTDYRRPHHTYRDAYDAARGLFFFPLT
jgi:hypothetical protein